VVAFTWMQIDRDISRGDSISRIEQMSRSGMIIVAVTAWFQFLALQLVAIVLMSTAISEEIHHGTLGTLMTTPITGLQIVGGKLASRLWHLVVLLAISLPVLTLVRIFGGVSWTFVVSSTCITLSTALFLGSVSLYFSIFNRRSYSVVLKTIRTAVVLYALLPALLAMLTARSGGRGSMTILRILAYINPYFTMALATTDLQRPGSNPFAVSWQGSCGVVLAATALVLGVSVRIVRKVALRQATGEAGLFICRRRCRRAWRRPRGRYR
jgi:ABC-type transport system involved in multi-copper enzyme maturation permease subunit